MVSSVTSRTEGGSSDPGAQPGVPATQIAWQAVTVTPGYQFAHLGCAVPYTYAPAASWRPYGYFTYYPAAVAPTYMYAAPTAHVPLQLYPSMIYAPTYIDAYTAHFGAGLYRYGESGHHRFPYYSYRRPWYFPGHPTFNRNTNFVW